MSTTSTITTSVIAETKLGLEAFESAMKRQINSQFNVGKNLREVLYSIDKEVDDMRTSFDQTVDNARANASFEDYCILNDLWFEIHKLFSNSWYNLRVYAQDVSYDQNIH